MTTFASDTRSRAVAAGLAIALQLLIGWALITGLSGRVVRAVEADLKVFEVALPPPPPPPKPVPVRHAARRPSGAAAPPHKRATPVPVVAPPPVITLPPVPAITAAPLPALGPDPASGAADAGNGTGAGGQGNGRGSGSGGNGTGSGGVRARWLRGEITGRDYPPEARAAHIEGNLTTRYVVDTRGRVARCYIAESSGSDLLDATTCRLAIQRLRFAPARDAAGNAVEDEVYEDHGWRISEDRPG
ncbi:MAG: TonB family protein [Sphingomonadaceae bacterium]|nr:TonB family protein [Sphingomonadaceae bacterium]